MSDWTPNPGERVAVIQVTDYGRSRSVDFAAVDRVGKRDIVLDDGRRFRVSDHYMHTPGGSTWAATRTKLIREDDPVVPEVEMEQRHRRLLSDARLACERFMYQRDGATAADAILALAPLTGVSDEIAALFGGAS